MEKVIQVGEIRVHPAMLETRSEDAPDGYVVATLALTIENRTTDKGKTVVEVFSAAETDDFKSQHISTTPRVIELARELHELMAQEVANDRGVQVRASQQRSAAYVQPE